MITFRQARPSIAREVVKRIFDAMLDPLGRNRLAQKAARGGDVIDAFQTTAGSVSVGTMRGQEQTFERKPSVKLLRNYAQYSVHVRTALNAYRDTVGRATPIVAPLDPKRKMDATVEARLKRLFDEPNELGQSYAEIREKAVEDHLVVGFYPLEFQIRGNAQPYRIYSMDAGMLGFVKGWNGDPRKPRYVELAPNGTVRRMLPSQMAMVLVNMAQSHSQLGLSHVEVLDQAVRTLLASNEFLCRRVSEPAPNGALNLGEGVNQQQVDEVRRRIEDSDRPFIVMGGTSNAAFIPFNATEAEMRVLDTQLEFIRQVAGIFQLPMALFAHNLEMSRANTEALLANKNEGLGALLWRIQEAENRHIAAKFGPVAQHNCYITYPAFNYKDMERQAEVTGKQIAGAPYISTNEARENAGLSRRKEKAADEVWVAGLTINGVPASLSMLDAVLAQAKTLQLGQPQEQSPQNEDDEEPVKPAKRKAVLSKAAHGDIGTDEEAVEWFEAGAPDDAIGVLVPEVVE